MVTYDYFGAIDSVCLTLYSLCMSTYTRAPLNFKERLAIRRDQIVLHELQRVTAPLAAEMLVSARMHLHLGMLTTGDLDGIVLLFHAEAAIRLEFK